MASKWITTHCARFDHGGCGFRVLVEDGKLLRIEPNSQDPFSHGYSCPKGRAAFERLAHPKRLTRPLMRKGKRGSGQWQPIGWDEALDEIVDQFTRATKAFGPEALAFAQGAPKGPEFFVLLRLANLLNTPNVAGSQHVCHMPRDQMAMLTCGFFPVADLSNPTRCVLLWGSNPLATNEEGILGGHLLRCLKENPSLIVVDPVKTELARRADIWLRIRPGSDDLLAMGFLHILIEEGLYDSEFVNEWTIGFDRLRDAVQPYTPEHVASGTWISRDDLVNAARTYASAHPAMIQWGNAIEHSVNSAQTCRCLVILMAISGNLEQPGGNIKVQAPQLQRLREFIRLDHYPDRAKKLLNRYHGITPRLITVPSWMVIESILQQSPYPIRCLYTQGTNPLITYAGTERVYQALKNLDFLVVAEQVMTPTAALADLVLPVALPLEYNDIGHYGLPHGYVLARPKAVEPRGECWPDVKILSELGKRLGFEKHFWDNPDDMLEEILAPTGLNYNRFVEQGILRGPRRYRAYEKKGFATPSGKVELFSSLLQKWGFDPLPRANEPARLDVDYPLLLTSKKPRNFFHSAYRHLDSLRRHHQQPQVYLHAETAARLGITDGQEVLIETTNGSIRQIARLVDYLDQRVVVVDYGWWFPELEEDKLFDFTSANLNMLTSAQGVTDPILGTTQMRALPCRVRPVMKHHG